MSERDVNVNVLLDATAFRVSVGENDSVFDDAGAEKEVNRISNVGLYVFVCGVGMGGGERAHYRRVGIIGDTHKTSPSN